ASWYQQDDLFRSDFDWLNARLNPSPAESRFLSSTGSPGTYRGATVNRAGNAVPTGGNRVPDPDCEAAGGVLRSASDSRCRYLFVDQVSIISGEERVQVFNEFEWEFSDQLRYYAEASYSNNRIERGSGGATMNTGQAVGGGFLIPASHPFNFFIQDPDKPNDIVYVGPHAWDNDIHTATDLQATARPLGREVNNTPLTQYIKRELNYSRFLNGIEFDISDTWSMDLSYGWAKSTRTTNAPHNYRSDVFQDLVRSGEWNPFGTRLASPGLVSPKDMTSVAGTSDITLAKFDTPSSSNARVLEQVTDLVFTGDLFEFNGNTVQGAFGSQYRDVQIDIYGDSLSSAGEANEASISGPVSGAQDVWAIFGEIAVPVTDTLELQLAVRREDYGGSIGDTTDPKVAFEFRPLDWLGFRGSWGTSFQAPTVRQTASATSSAFIDDPASPTGPGGSTVCVSTGLNNNITVSVQGSPDLAPQESENFNFGVVLQLENNFNASVDYFNFDYQDLIAQSAGAQAIVDNDCADDGIPNDPRVIRDAGGQLRQVNTEFVNIGSVETSGFDVNLAWDVDVGAGDLFLNAAATYVTEFAVQDGSRSYDGAGSRNFRNNFSTLPELRAHFGATYSWNDSSVTAKFRHIDEYRNDQSNNGIVEAWNVLDAQYNQVFPGLLGLGDTSVTVGVNNLLDEDPPRLTRLDASGRELPPFAPSAGGVIYNGASDRPGYDDRAGHDLRGRIVYVRFTQDF
ncbi:MAG: TonB-dependent receptor, partial [Gammaproteobacteria bacterium]|nr:TonB-dependent receptor [Gammaproteobacteria bacterium]